MSATVINFPKPFVPAIRCIDPVDRDELKAAGVLCLIAADRPEKTAEIVERVREFLGRYSITSGSFVPTLVRNQSEDAST